MKHIIIPGILVTLCLVSAPVQADCGQHLSDAKASLEGMKQKALARQKLDPQASALQIKAHIDAMAREQCLSEMQALMQYIESEQRTYPDPRSNPGAYGQ